ncbi:asparagine synthase (glutamine-hydrolyzing) [Methanocaldococcus infernus]
MCGIAGIVCKEESLEGSLLVEMLKAIEHRGRDNHGIFYDNELIYTKDLNNVDNFEIRSIALGHNRLAIVGKTAQPLYDDELCLVCNGEIYNYRELMEQYEFKTDCDCEAIFYVYKEGFDILDGDYALALYDSKNNLLFLARDPFGVKPLFYINTKKYFAFASERKALWKLLIREGYEKDLDILNKNIKRVEQNSALIYNLDTNKFREIRGIVKLGRMKIESYEKAKKYLEEDLKKAVFKRVAELNRVAIICSGGLDSSLVAALSVKYNRNVKLYSVGLEGSEDLKYSQMLADHLGVELKVKVIEEDEFEEYLFKTAKAVDEINMLNLGVGLPIYVASELISKDKNKVALSGQGADELFLGYSKYYKMSKEELEKKMLEDLKNIGKVNLERDDHCTMANTVELRVPFLDLNVVKTSLSMPIEFKLSEDRKRILRDIALNYLPKEIALRPKKAAQYSSGGEKIIYRVAKRYGYSKRKIDEFLNLIKRRILEYSLSSS